MTQNVMETAVQSGQAGVQGAVHGAANLQEAGEPQAAAVSAALRWTPPEAPLSMPRQELERTAGARREARGLARMFGRSFAA